MITIKDLKTPDTWSPDDWEQYVYEQLLGFMEKHEMKGETARYKVVGYKTL